MFVKMHIEFPDANVYENINREFHNLEDNNDTRIELNHYRLFLVHGAKIRNGTYTRPFPDFYQSLIDLGMTQEYLMHFSYAAVPISYDNIVKAFLAYEASEIESLDIFFDDNNDYMHPEDPNFRKTVTELFVINDRKTLNKWISKPKNNPVVKIEDEQLLLLYKRFCWLKKFTYNHIGDDTYALKGYIYRPKTEQLYPEMPAAVAAEPVPYAYTRARGWGEVAYGAQATAVQPDRIAMNQVTYNRIAEMLQTGITTNNTDEGT